MNPLAILDSDLCARLVLTLGHLLWQATVPGARASAAVWFLRRASANARSAALVMALCLMAACPPVTFLLVDVAPEQAPPRGAAPAAAPRGSVGAPRASHSSDRSDLSDGSPAPSRGGPQGTGRGWAEREAPPEPEGPASPPTAAWWRRFAPHLTLVYLGGVVLMAARLVVGGGSGRRLRRGSEPIGETDLLALIARQARRIGLKVLPAVAWCGQVAAPTVVGVFRATILLPLGLAAGLSTEQLAALLTHELAHVRRYDHLLNILQRL